MSILAFNIAQFFSMILDKAGFDSRKSWFFSDYLINRYTQNAWNSFTSLFLKANVRIGQRSTLSPILLALYITPILHILRKGLKIFLFLFQFLFYHLLTMVCLFLRKKTLKNQMPIFSVVIILSLPFSNNLVLLSNMTSQKFCISLEYLKTLILLL